MHLDVFVLMTSTLSLALHPTFYDQCTIVGTNPRATAVKTNPQANSHRSLLAHSLLRHAQDNMPHDTPSAIVLVTVTPHRLHLQNIGHARFVYVCNERHIANTYLHCARHSSICRQCCFSGCEKLGGRTGFALLPWFLSMSDYHFWGNTTFGHSTASSFAKLQRCGSCESGWHHWWVGYKACRKRGTKSCDVPKSNLEEAPIDGVGNSAYRLYNFLVALTDQWIVQQDPRLLL